MTDFRNIQYLYNVVYVYCVTVLQNPWTFHGFDHNKNKLHVNIFRTHY